MTRGIDPVSYRAVAENYTTLQVNATAGERAGVAKDPRFNTLLQTTRLRALAGMYRAQQYKHALKAASDEVEPYYKSNTSAFEEVDLDRFLIPKNNPLNLTDETFRAKAKRVAEKMHARAVQGEDLANLEKEALAELGDTTAAIIQVGVRRGQLEDKADKEIFALAPNQVTSLLDERGLWMFFRRTSRQVLSLDTVRSEILGRLFRDKLEAIDKNLHDEVKVDYNEAYFGPSPEKAKAMAEVTSKISTATSTGQRSAPAIVSAKDVVMTIHGLCRKSAQHTSPKGCTVSITREQFEPVLAVALLTGSRSTPSTPRSVAKDYLDTLIYAYAAERAGLDKDPHFANVTQLARQRALSDMYRLKLEEDAHQIAPAAIKAYYRNHLAAFDEVTLTHFSVPTQNPAKPNDHEFVEQAKHVASDFRDRAARGENMDKLQREAYEKLGLKNPPATLMKPLRRGALEKQTEQEIFALKAGQVTTVKDIPSAYVFYKLQSRRKVPLREVTPEISYLFYRQKLERLTKTMTKSLRAEYNEAYFSSLAPAGALSASAHSTDSHQPSTR